MGANMDAIEVKVESGGRRPVLLVLLTIVAFLGACAPMQQSGLHPTTLVKPGFSGDWFTSFDGARLGLTTWRPAQPLGETSADPNLVIIAIHGMNDYAGAFNAAGKWW